jgi:hypothetical protein
LRSTDEVMLALNSTDDEIVVGMAWDTDTEEVGAFTTLLVVLLILEVDSKLVSCTLRAAGINTLA